MSTVPSRLEKELRDKKKPEHTDDDLHVGHPGDTGVTPPEPNLQGVG